MILYYDIILHYIIRLHYVVDYITKLLQMQRSLLSFSSSTEDFQHGGS